MQKSLTRSFTAIVAVVTLSTGLAACGTPAKKTTAKPVAKATIKLVVNKKALSTKKVTIAKKETILAAMKKHYQVKVTKGFITAINGHAQDPATNTYWMYKVNGKMATKGANQLTLKKGDQVTWTLAPTK
ncbi:MAG: DUF4430 domain-containing protein [Lactobacillus sp.]|jgi:type IV pilus biogenesis protein CpaD/CtpE|nr:DUF4430 domain-containing protein [Lactobacillus sp.]MCI2033390.1 DUF4430 domain-containing protein [Lactobacillus sp.]